MAKARSKYAVWGGAAAVVLGLAVAVALILNFLAAEDGQRRRRAIQTVTLVKPPPPEIKPKPPEPEVKKEEIIEPKPEEKPKETPQETKEAPPPGDRLGLDAEGGAGSDAFGLVANKGGGALIGSGGGGLLQRFGWYTSLIQNDLRKLLQDHFERNGGVPAGNCKVSVQIRLDDQGRIVGHRVIDPCGDGRLDEAVEQVLQSARISEPPPADMPRTVKIRISARG